MFKRFTTPFLLKRLVVELRGIRKALERQADLAELQAGSAPRAQQSFRSFSHLKEALDGEGSEVSYIDDRVAARAAEKEEELIGLLGREPTPDEVEMALRGDIE